MTATPMDCVQFIKLNGKIFNTAFREEQAGSYPRGPLFVVIGKFEGLPIYRVRNTGYKHQMSLRKWTK